MLPVFPEMTGSEVGMAENIQTPPHFVMFTSCFDHHNVKNRETMHIPITNTKHLDQKNNELHLCQMIFLLNSAANK